MLQRKLRPSTARVNVQLDPRHAASKHTTAPINHTRPSPGKHSPDGAIRARKNTHPITAYYSVYRPRKDERLSRPEWLVTYRNKVPHPGVKSGHVTHPRTNRARRRVTSLLPLRHAATRRRCGLLSNFFDHLKIVTILHTNPPRHVRQQSKNISQVHALHMQL